MGSPFSILSFWYKSAGKANESEHDSENVPDDSDQTVQRKRMTLQVESKVKELNIKYRKEILETKPQTISLKYSSVQRPFEFIRTNYNSVFVLGQQLGISPTVLNAYQGLYTVKSKTENRNFEVANFIMNALDNIITQHCGESGQFENLNIPELFHAYYNQFLTSPETLCPIDLNQFGFIMDHMPNWIAYFQRVYRVQDDQLKILNPQGLGMQKVSIAACVFQKALKMMLGTLVDCTDKYHCRQKIDEDLDRDISFDEWIQFKFVIDDHVSKPQWMFKTHQTFKDNEPIVNIFNTTFATAITSSTNVEYAIVSTGSLKQMFTENDLQYINPEESLDHYSEIYCGDFFTNLPEYCGFTSKNISIKFQFSFQDAVRHAQFLASYKPLIMENGKKPRLFMIVVRYVYSKLVFPDVWEAQYSNTIDQKQYDIHPSPIRHVYISNNEEDKTFSNLQKYQKGIMIFEI
jgi:hypothetical protein